MAEVTEVYNLEGDLIAISGNAKYRKPEFVSDNPASAFARGAYSFPRDWWVTIHWANGLNGLYGENIRLQAIQIGRSLDHMLALARAGAPVTFKITWVVLKYIFTSELTGYVPLDEVLKRIDRKQFLNGTTNTVASFAGRAAGGMFTNYATTGGRAGSRKIPKTSKLRKGGKVGNVSMAAMGSLIVLASKTRAIHVTTIDIMIAMMTGRIQTGFSNEVYKEIYREVIAADLPYSPTEEEAFYKIMDDAKSFFDMKRREAASSR